MNESLQQKSPLNRLFALRRSICFFTVRQCVCIPSPCSLLFVCSCLFFCVLVSVPACLRPVSLITCLPACQWIHMLFLVLSQQHDSIPTTTQHTIFPSQLSPATLPPERAPTCTAHTSLSFPNMLFYPSKRRRTRFKNEFKIFIPCLNEMSSHFFPSFSFNTSAVKSQWCIIFLSDYYAQQHRSRIQSLEWPGMVSTAVAGSISCVCVCVFLVGEQIEPLCLFPIWSSLLTASELLLQKQSCSPHVCWPMATCRSFIFIHVRFGVCFQSIV